MKRLIIFALILVTIFGLVGCNHRSMNYIIDHEPSIVGIVEEVYESYILINIKSEEYLKGQDCKVSLEVENKDSYTEISVGDEVFVYYDGNISESDPLQINTVYAITLKTPANR